MSALSTFRLRIWTGAEPGVSEVPLSADGVALRCLPGATGVHIVLSDDAGVRLRAEIGAEPGELVPFGVELDETGAPQLRSHGRNILLLPTDARYDPPLPIRPVAADAPVDVAIVVDGTTRVWPETPKEQGSRLLDDRNAWAAHADKLVALVGEIARGREARVSVLAFGDQEAAGVTAADLRPRYRVLPAPEEQVFQQFTANDLKERLLTIPSTPGGDFTDALADALEACVQLRWAPTSRRVVIVTGDSPGCSLMHPLPKGADLCVRARDVDTQAAHLHRRQVEIATIYHAPGPAASAGLYAIDYQRELLLAARAQYARLASVRDLAFEAPGFDPAAAASLLRQLPHAIGRGVTLGELAPA